MNQSYEGRLPYVNMVLMLLVDSMLYFLLAWYLDKVKRTPRTERQFLPHQNCWCCLRQSMNRASASR